MKEQILNRIYSMIPTQESKTKIIFAENPKLENELKLFLSMYQPFMEKASISADEIADAYVELIENSMASRLEFLRSGSYPHSDQFKIYRDVYDNKKLMTRHMLGLALSQFLWRHHYKIYNFYKDEVAKLKEGKHLLEIGPGHGLYTLELVRHISKAEKLDVIDISDAALELTKNIFESIASQFLDRINFFKGDVTEYNFTSKYDFISMGEVLEHVEHPNELLNKLSLLLNPDGILYISTCANCPTIDHVYHYHTVNEIRDMIDSCGYKIMRELVAPSEEKDEATLLRLKIDISYAALLQKK